MSGGYGGAQAHALVHGQIRQSVSPEKRRLGICFQAIVPQQMVLGTGVGDAGANAYARAMGMKPEEFVARFGKPMPLREFGWIRLFPCWMTRNTPRALPSGSRAARKS